ncbi:MAG: DUF5058 family protein [Clostridia bacterium]|nr:DUF5058 family protein [Clostridia bacterium]
MNTLEQLSGGTMYLICGAIVAFVAVVCVVFLIRAWRAGKAIGMDPAKMRKAVTASATFTILPSVGILLGVIALSGSLGIPWPWLRLSVIGALHYETQVATAAAEQIGLKSLSGSAMTPRAFTTIALLMSVCIMWGMILATFFGKRYLSSLSRRKPEAAGEAPRRSFGDAAMTAMFVGMVSAYIGSYLGGFISGEGLFTFAGPWIPLVTAAVAALAMALFTWLSERRGIRWLESFSIAGSMLLGMAAAVLAGML